MAKKQPSQITIAKIGGNYKIDARGTFGGGYTQQVSNQDIKSALAIAWMQYGNNPLGCEIIGDTAGLEDYIQTLQSNRKSDNIILRVSPAEKISIESAATQSGLSVAAYLLNLHSQKSPGKNT